MNYKKLLLSENGAATVLEATIIYPIVCLVTVLLVFVGFTYAQQGFLTYHSQTLSSYLAKTVCYPGYQFIDDPYHEDEDGVTVDDINKAMKAQAPYRYLFGVFSGQYNAPDDNNEDLIANYVKFMAEDYLTEHGFLKSSGGNVELPDDISEFTPERIVNKNGYACAIDANTSRVIVYMGQNYMFANFFRMIGFGGRQMVISSKSCAFVSDALEIVRITDMAFDVTDHIAGKLGINTEQISKIGDTIKKFTQGE